MLVLATICLAKGGGAAKPVTPTPAPAALSLGQRGLLLLHVAPGINKIREETPDFTDKLPSSILLRKIST